MGWKILLPQDIRPEGKDFLLSQGHTLIEGRGTDTLKMIQDVKDADAIITRAAVISREVMNAGKNLKAIACFGSGYGKVDLDAAREKKITVVNSPDATAISTAEITLFYMLYCSRKFTAVRRDYIDDYESAARADNKEELWDKTLGIVGCGRIGTRVARICRDSFHMKVLAYDPYLRASEFPEGVDVIRELSELLGSSDYVSLHFSQQGTGGLRFGMSQFKKMKPTAFLINTAYVEAVSEPELLEACREGVIAGAALDGIGRIPPDRDDPIFYTDRILIAPRIASATREAQTRASLQTAMGLQEVYEGKTPTWELKKPDEGTRTVYKDRKKKPGTEQ